MTVPEFIPHIKRKSAFDITIQDCKTYCRLFFNVDEDRRQKLLGGEARQALAKALKVYWEASITQYALLGKNMVETPSGFYLKSNKNPNNPTRIKWNKAVPLDMPVKECKEIYRRLDIG